MLRVAHILILVDPAADNPALDHALRWAAAYDATVHALAVHMTEGDALPNVPPAIRPSEPVRDVVRSHSEGEYASLTVHSRCVTAATVVRGLSQYTDRHAVDLVVVPPGPDEWASSGVSPRQLAQLVDQTACPARPQLQPRRAAPCVCSPRLIFRGMPKGCSTVLHRSPLCTAPRSTCCMSWSGRRT